MALDLRPFGFTPTESLVYATLLRLGPSTGYAVARGARLARANAYGALEGLGREVRGLSRPGDPVTREVAGSRAVANLVTQLVARAERSVEGVMALELWRPTLPAWRRAAERATLTVRARGGLPPDAPGWLEPAPSDAPDATVLLIDDTQLVMTSGDGEAVAGLWTSHPLILLLARRALRGAA